MRNLDALRRRFFIKLGAKPVWTDANLSTCEIRVFRTHELCTEPCVICSPERHTAVHYARHQMMVDSFYESGRLMR